MSPVFNRQSLLNVAKSLVFCALLLAMLGAAQVLFTPTPGTVSPWAAVRETRGEADVVVLGSSRAYCSVLPMEMWRDSGITALDVTSGVSRTRAVAAVPEAGQVRVAQPQGRHA